jgi:hypothetical protein
MSSRYGWIYFLGLSVQGSTFRVEKKQPMLNKGIVSSSGFQPVSLNGVMGDDGYARF